MRHCIVSGQLDAYLPSRETHLENVLCLGQVRLNDEGGECSVRACTVAGINIAKGCDGNTVKNSIVGWITAATPNNTIENCDVYDNEPYRDLASKAKAEKNGCFSCRPAVCSTKRT